MWTSLLDTVSLLISPATVSFSFPRHGTARCRGQASGISLVQNRDWMGGNLGRRENTVVLAGGSIVNRAMRSNHVVVVGFYLEA